MRARHQARLLVLMNDVGARDRDHEFADRRRRRARPGEMLSTAWSIGNGALLRICQRTISCRSAGRAGTFSSLSSETFATVSGTTSDTREGALPPSCASVLAITCDSAGTSDMFSAEQAGRDQAVGDRLAGMGGDHRLAATPRQPRRGHMRVIDLNGDVGRRCLEQIAEAHSTNVTLLISFSVVSPSITRSTADSRSSRMPCSFAARFTSEIGRLSRMISRM